MLKGKGDRLSRNLVRISKKHKPFNKIEYLSKVQSIGPTFFASVPKNFLKMKNLLLTLTAIVFCFSYTIAQNNLEPCEGSTEKYSVPAVSGAGTYLWDVTNGGAVTSIIGNCVFVNWHTPGTDTLTVVTIDSLGMLDTITEQINVHPLPDPLITATASFTSTCAGDSSQHNGPGGQGEGQIGRASCRERV